MPMMPSGQVVPGSVLNAGSPGGTPNLAPAPPPPQAQLNPAAASGPGAGGAATAEGAQAAMQNPELQSAQAPAGQPQDPMAAQSPAAAAGAPPQAAPSSWLPGVNGQALYGNEQGPVVGQVPKMAGSTDSQWMGGLLASDRLQRRNVPGAGISRSGDTYTALEQAKMAVDAMSLLDLNRIARQSRKTRQSAGDPGSAAAQHAALVADAPTLPESASNKLAALTRSTVGEGNFAFREAPWSVQGADAWPTDESYGNPKNYDPRIPPRQGTTKTKIAYTKHANRFKGLMQVGRSLLGGSARGATPAAGMSGRGLFAQTMRALPGQARSALGSAVGGAKNMLPKNMMSPGPAYGPAASAVAQAAPTAARSGLNLFGQTTTKAPGAVSRFLGTHAGTGNKMLPGIGGPAQQATRATGLLGRPLQTAKNMATSPLMTSTPLGMAGTGWGIGALVDRFNPESMGGPRNPLQLDSAASRFGLGGLALGAGRSGYQGARRMFGGAAPAASAAAKPNALMNAIKPLAYTGGGAAAYAVADKVVNTGSAYQMLDELGGQMVAKMDDAGMGQAIRTPDGQVLPPQQWPEQFKQQMVSMADEAGIGDAIRDPEGNLVPFDQWGNAIQQHFGDGIERMATENGLKGPKGEPIREPQQMIDAVMAEAQKRGQTAGKAQAYETAADLLEKATGKRPGSPAEVDKTIGSLAGQAGSPVDSIMGSLWSGWNNLSGTQKGFLGVSLGALLLGAIGFFGGNNTLGAIGAGAGLLTGAMGLMGNKTPGIGPMIFGEQQQQQPGGLDQQPGLTEIGPGPGVGGEVPKPEFVSPDVWSTLSPADQADLAEALPGIMQANPELADADVLNARLLDLINERDTTQQGDQAGASAMNEMSQRAGQAAPLWQSGLHAGIGRRSAN